LDGHVVLNVGGEIFQVASVGKINHPLGGKDKRIVAVGTGSLIGKNFLVQIGEWHSHDRDLCAGEILEFRSVSLEWLGDLRTIERQKP